MRGKYEVCRGLFHAFDWSPWRSGTARERLSVLPAAQEHILAQEDGKARLLRSVTELSHGDDASGENDGREDPSPHRDDSLRS